MHVEVMEFLNRVKRDHPQYFESPIARILELGSRNINGSPRALFHPDAEYIGVDLSEGDGVDVVARAHHAYWKVGGGFDVVVSTEMLEHDANYNQTLAGIELLTRTFSLVVITCATTGRKPHGTKWHSPEDSPETNDYYHNVTTAEFMKYLPKRLFVQYLLEVDRNLGDLYFMGIRG